MKDFLEVASIIDQVKQTASKKDKEAIFAQHSYNTLLGEVLNHIYNPFVKTNLAKKKMAKKVAEPTSEPLKGIHEYMVYLSRSTGRDEHVGVVQQFIASQPAETHWLLEAMATKELKIGATSSTINKAFGDNFIPTFDLMLAEKYIEIKKIKGIAKTYEHWRRYIGQQVIATKKLDGNRNGAFVRSGDDVKIYTREGHIVEGCLELEAALSKFPAGQVYDGEILATNEEGLDSQALFKKTSKIMKKKGVKTGLEFHTFDLLPIAEFENGGFDVPCLTRKKALETVVGMKNDPLIHYVSPLYVGEFDFELLEGLAKEATARKEEGIMVQLAEAPYECKRTFSILKVKSFESADIKCVGMYEGKSGENIGRLGGLVLLFKGFEVNIGGGFSSKERDEFWENPDMVLGKIIEIKYFEEFEDEEGDLDLRFGTFKTIRTDKTEESYY